MDDIIQEGYNVVLMKNFDFGNMKIVEARRDSNCNYGKLHFDPSPLIGAKFGTVFEIKDNKMNVVENFEEFDQELSNLVSNKLTTLTEKTLFSQEKIVKKKKRQNHANIVTAIRPTILMINEMLFARDKLGGLRMDSLSQILTLANIQNGTKCLLLDHNLGLITGAIMSRSLPDGICIQLLPDNEAVCTTRKTLRMLNITDQICLEHLYAITVRDLYKVKLGINDFSHENEILRNKVKGHIERLSSYHTQSHTNRETGEKMEIELSHASRRDLRDHMLRKDVNRETRNQERVGATQYLKPWSLDSIILVVQNDEPINLLRLVYSFLAPSRQFVIYSDSIEPLIECHQYLKTQSLAVSLRLSETWLRRYQVLPDRTRPEMNTTGFGGYLLSGIKALTSVDAGDETYR